MVFSREERAAISKNFRTEIQQHGLSSAILGIVESSSEKVGIRKLVLQQQCRKAAFAAEFQARCDALIENNPRLKGPIKALKNEIMMVK